MVKPILVIFGATGNQGGSVINAFLSDSILAQKYTVRAVTRDPSQASAKALQARGAEVVQGDVDDVSCLPRVLRGATAVFLVTVTVYDGQLKQREFRQAKAVTDAAIAAGASQIIFSSLPDATAIARGKVIVTPFDSKVEVEEYIRSLSTSSKGAIKCTFFNPAVFMQSFHGWMHPKPLGDGTYAVYTPYLAETVLPLIDVYSDTGKLVASAVEDPVKYDGKVFSAGLSRLYTLQEIVDTISQVTGKKVVLKTVDEDEYRTQHPPESHEALYSMRRFLNEFPYYGTNARQELEWTNQQTYKGQKLTTLEEYFEKNPFHLN